jgi:hypothetical protein
MLSFSTWYQSHYCLGVSFKPPFPVRTIFFFPFERSFLCFFLFQHHTKCLLRLFLCDKNCRGFLFLKIINSVKKRSSTCLPPPTRTAMRRKLYLHMSYMHLTLSTRHTHQLHSPTRHQILAHYPLVYSPCCVPCCTGSLPACAP